ncbi:MAG: nucleotidyltransferase family protein [Mariprofundaceae bacterium]|nr:nucleotidyltransferase family protein [Mariprofundaceae bacterium]
MNMRQKAGLRELFCHCLGGTFAVPDIVGGALVVAAQTEGVGSLFSFRMLNRDDWHDAGEMRSYLNEVLHEQAAWSLRIRHTARQVFEALNRAGIPFVCMRGIAVVEELYGDMAPLRPVSDIDILLDEALMLDAKQVLWDIGFRPDQTYRNIYSRGEMHIDLHHEPLGIERIQAWQYLTPLRREDFFRYSEAGELADEKALLVHPRVNLPYLCFHAMKHSFERLIWLYDIALLANRVGEESRWSEVFEGIREQRLERPCFYALSYVNAHLGASVPEDLLESIRPGMGFIERTLFKRHMRHEVIPYLAERLFARMQPDLRHRIEFWRETIYPRHEVRAQMVQTGCVKCNFIRKRLKQLFRAAWLLTKEGLYLLRA